MGYNPPASRETTMTEKANKPHAVDGKDWESWSPEQRAYVVATQGKPTGKVTLGSGLDTRWYDDKRWKLDAARPRLGEVCPACGFAYCFYALPRNWAMGSDSDAWNLMRCANVACGALFDSCT
jgi:hypothetical protein